MQARPFEHFLQHLSSLTRRQRERLLAVLMPLRGVASRYLANYLGWRWALDGGRIRTPEGLLRTALGVQLPARSHT